MTVGSVSVGSEALGSGRWADARAAFESVLAFGDDGHARFGLANALWWQGDNQGAVRDAARAYVLFRQAGDVPAAIRCAVWLGLVYHGDFANYAAANGWVSRATTLLDGLEQGPLHGWVQLVRAGLLPDLPRAEELTQTALRLAREGGDPDLELSALSQLGKIRISRGAIDDGFALIDEAMAAALAGERTTLDTVVNTGCDMLNACELANDVVRAEQWCRVVDEFVERFGCPYLYAECRIYYGSILVAKGRWAEAEHELTIGIRVTREVSPGLHARAETRLAWLRIRQGDLDEASKLLATVGVDAGRETESTLCHAALRLALGDAASASRSLHQCCRQLPGHGPHLGDALAMLVQASLANGDDGAAAHAARTLTELATRAGSAELDALAAGARGRVSAAGGDTGAAVADLRSALATWSRLHQPFESAMTRSVLGAVLVGAGDPAGVACLRQALDGFRQLGAVAEADRVAGHLRSLRVPIGAASMRPGSLSAREEQVMRLVAAGLSNPEIASRLQLSRKTVGHHVSHILTKQGLRNRAEIAAFVAAEQRMGPLLQCPPMPQIGR